MFVKDDAQAEELLRQDAVIAERAVLRLIKVPLTDGQCAGSGRVDVSSKGLSALWKLFFIVMKTHYVEGFRSSSTFLLLSFSSM